MPIGHPSFITAHMAAKFKEQALLFERIPFIEDVQVGWLLLVFCAATRANNWLRTVPPKHTTEYAEQPDQSVLRCLSSMLQMVGLPPHTHEAASMSLTMGGLGVGRCSRIQHAAHWGSWADCLEMVKHRHPQVAEDIIRGMNMAHGHMAVVEESGARLREVGLDTPDWKALAGGLRPGTEEREREPCQVSHGWQKVASESVHEHHRVNVVWPQLSPSERALVRSRSGPLSSVPFTALLLRRLRLPLPFTVCTCRCGRPLDAFGHHRAACSTGGLLGRRRFAAESAIGLKFWEGGARVSTNVMVRDLDSASPHRSDLRRLEVVAEGLTLGVPIGH